MQRKDKPQIRQQVVAIPLPPLPFSCNILAPQKPGGNDPDGGSQLQDQFPASYRFDNDDLRAPLIPEIDLIAKELSVKRLQDIIHLLWLSGRPVPPRPLHHQQALGREITVTERMESHLIWGSGRIFAKPIPRYLLNPLFWEDHLACNRCQGGDDAAVGGDPLRTPSSSCQHPQLRACALGFLLSYVALVAYESDFAIAKEKRLIPAEVTWLQWRQLVREILAEDGANCLYAHVAPRFIYGELRLNRLNLIFFARHGPFSSGFVATWHSFGSFYRDNSAWIITIAAYVILILSAAQVALSTTKTVDNDAFQTGSFGFSVFAIILPGFTLGMLVFISTILWAYNVMRTRQFEVRRAKVLRRTWRHVRGTEGD